MKSVVINSMINVYVKKYLKEIIILLLQLFMFYVFPIFMFLFEPIGTVMLILLSTIILSIILTIISKNKIKYLYPIIIALLFIPTIFLYYNESALVHSLWYLIVSFIGIIIGGLINFITKISK